jgi:hypothetical protein
LYSQALRFFRSWASAISKAGLSISEVKEKAPKYPTARSVLAGIRKRRKAGESLLSSRVTNGEHRDPTLYHTAYRFFESWPDAVTKAGIDYATVKAEHVRRGRFPR